MLNELAVATAMVITTVIIHSVGLVSLSRLVRQIAAEERPMALPTLTARGLAAIAGVVLALFGLHGIEIWLYGFVFLLVGATSELRDAIYYSTEAYAAIGFSDQFIADEWKLLGAIEGINGLLLLGWSTAFFVTAITRLVRQ